jgi:hypothetical protein
MPLEETQAPESTQVAAPGQDQVSEESICGNTWECRCAAYKTQAACAGITGCFWYYNRCAPTYE